MRIHHSYDINDWEEAEGKKKTSTLEEVKSFEPSFEEAMQPHVHVEMVLVHRHTDEGHLNRMSRMLEHLHHFCSLHDHDHYDEHHLGHSGNHPNDSFHHVPGASLLLHLYLECLRVSASFPVMIHNQPHNTALDGEHTHHDLRNNKRVVRVHVAGNTLNSIPNEYIPLVVLEVVLLIHDLPS